MYLHLFIVHFLIPAYIAQVVFLQVYEHKHSNKLIEEFMLLANMAVARKIYTIFPDLAVLR